MSEVLISQIISTISLSFRLSSQAWTGVSLLVVYDKSAGLYCVVRPGSGAKIGFIIQQ